MAVTTDDVKKAARLAQIAVTDDRLEPLASELDSIVNWIEQLNDVDIDGVEPMAGISNAETPMRPDVVTDGNKQADVLANAPRAEHGYFVVPKAID